MRSEGERSSGSRWAWTICSFHGLGAFLLLPPIPPSIRFFSNESTLRMRWPKNWSFSFSIIPSKEHPLFFLNQRAFPQNQFCTLQGPGENVKGGRGSRSKLTEHLKMATAALSTELGTLLSLETRSKSTKAGPTFSSTLHHHRH